MFVSADSAVAERFFQDDTIKYIIVLELKLYNKSDVVIDCLMRDCGLKEIKIESWTDISSMRNSRNKFVQFMKIVEHNQDVKQCFRTAFLIRESYMPRGKRDYKI